MSPIFLGGTRQNQLRVGGTRINRAYVGSTLVYSSEFIGTVSIVVAITYAGETIVDTNCIPNGATIAMVAQISGTATDATFAWTKPVGSSAPVADLTTNTLTWTAVAGDGGTYGVTVSSRNSSDSTQSAAETINIFGYTMPAFTDADANQWITRIELRDCGQLEPGVRNAMNQLVVDLKTSGFFSNSHVIHPLVGPRNVRSLIPLKAPSGWYITSSKYDRQFGLRNDNTGGTAVSVAHPSANLASRLNAGSAGIATYVTRWYGDTFPPNPNSFWFASFARDGDFTSEVGNIKLGYDFSNFTVLVLGIGQAVGNFTVAGARNTAFFTGASVTGTTTRKVDFRVNATLGTQTFGALTTPNPSTSSGVSVALLNNPQFIDPVYFVDSAFLIAGGGTSDYSSSALRTIVETYVTAIQAAIPG
jgi:hypothetical protein